MNKKSQILDKFENLCEKCFKLCTISDSEIENMNDFINDCEDDERLEKIYEIINDDSSLIRLQTFINDIKQENKKYLLKQIKQDCDKKHIRHIQDSIGFIFSDCLYHNKLSSEQSEQILDILTYSQLQEILNYL